MNTVEIEAKVRETKGKIEAKKLRASGATPAVVYGDKDAKSISIDGNQLLKVFRQSPYGKNTVLNLKLDDGSSELVIAKDISRHPIKNDLIHTDFFRVSEKKKIVVKVPLHLEGTAKGLRFGGILIQNRNELRLSCYPQDIQEVLSLDITDMEIGDILRIKDVPIPEGSEIVANPKFVVARMEAPRVAGSDDDEETEGAVESAEGGDEAAAEGGDDAAAEG